MNRFFSVLVASLISASLVSMPLRAEAHGHRSKTAAKAVKASKSDKPAKAGKASRANRSKKSEVAVSDKSSGKKAGKHHERLARSGRHAHGKSVQSASEIRARDEAEALALWRNAQPVSTSPQQSQTAALRKAEPERPVPDAPRSEMRSRPALPTEAGMPGMPGLSTSTASSTSNGPLAVPTLPFRLSHGAPARAYARDGITFYQNGKKYRIRGLDVSDASIETEHAKQRLQKALDGGVVSVDGIDTDRSGNVLADVKVNGRDVKEILQESR